MVLCSMNSQARGRGRRRGAPGAWQAAVEGGLIGAGGSTAGMKQRGGCKHCPMAKCGTGMRSTGMPWWGHFKANHPTSSPLGPEGWHMAAGICSPAVTSALRPCIGCAPASLCTHYLLVAGDAPAPAAAEKLSSPRDGAAASGVSRAGTGQQQLSTLNLL